MMNSMPKSRSQAASPCFLEAIRLHNGEAQNMSYHLQRMEASIASCTDRRQTTANAQQIAAKALALAEDMRTKNTALQECETLKLRFSYSPAGLNQLELRPYSKAHIQKLHIRQLPHNLPLEQIYSFKYCDRQLFSQLKSGLEATDDIILVYNKRITDAGFASLAFRKAGGKWQTPSTPLLPGTSRTRLLQSGEIGEAEITIQNCTDFDEVCLFNAMLPLAQLCLPISAIQFTEHTEKQHENTTY